MAFEYQDQGTNLDNCKKKFKLHLCEKKKANLNVILKMNS